MHVLYTEVNSGLNYKLSKWLKPIALEVCFDILIVHGYTTLQVTLRPSGHPPTTVTLRKVSAEH
jgi:hypothetical protein